MLFRGVAIALKVCETPLDADFIDCLLDRVADQVHVDGRGALLANTVDSSDGLKFDRRVDERLAKEDVLSIDEVETRRVGFGVEEEALDAGICAEAINGVW